MRAIVPRTLGLLLVAVSACEGASSPATGASLSTAQWRSDLRTLATELPKRHANAFHAVSRARFDSAIAALDAALPRFDDDEREVGFRHVVAMIGDGHTGLSVPGDLPLLPLRFRWFGDPVHAPSQLELRVTQAAAPYEGLLGTRVTRVGDSTTAGAYEALTTIIADGETVGSRRAAAATYLRRPSLLHGLHLSATRDSIRLEVADDSGSTHVAWIRPMSAGQRPQWRSAALHEPLYRTRDDDPFWFTLLADASGDSSTVYLAFNSYPGWLDFWWRTRALTRYVDEHHARRLIVDLRDNGGGDYNEGRRILLPALRDHPSVSAPGHLYVLTGPVTFSAAMTNAADLRRELHAVLVGEPTGARPNQYQERGLFTLPNSGWRVSVATRYYHFAPTNTPGVLPDHYAAPTWADYRAGKDPALAWVLARH